MKAFKKELTMLAVMIVLAIVTAVANPLFLGGDNIRNNVRHISLMDPAKPTVKMQLPGPERDGPTNFVGPDLLGQWVTNTYFDFAFGDQISAAAVSTQSFTAQ